MDAVEKALAAIIAEVIETYPYLNEDKLKAILFQLIKDLKNK